MIWAQLSLSNIVDNFEQYGQQNIAQYVFINIAASFSFFAVYLHAYSATSGLAFEIARNKLDLPAFGNLNGQNVALGTELQIIAKY